MGGGGIKQFSTVVQNSLYIIHRSHMKINGTIILFIIYFVQ